MQKFLFSILILSSGAVLGGFYFNNKRQNIINDLIKTVEDIVTLKEKLISIYEKIKKEINKVDEKNKEDLFGIIRQILFEAGIKSMNLEIDLQNNKEIEEETTEDFGPTNIDFDLDNILNLSKEFADTLEKLYEKCFKLFRNPFEKYRSEIEKLGYKNIDNKQITRLISIQEKIYLLDSDKNNYLKEAKENFIFKDLKLSGELVTDDEEFLSALKKHEIFKIENPSTLTINLGNKGESKDVYETFKFDKEEKLTSSLWKSLIDLNKTPEEIKNSIESSSKKEE